MPGQISVIVPVYNVEAYLETCLESLAQQSVSDLEVVMVDDGSTDESAAIAERYVERDPRFKLVRQRNAGLGAARNTGVPHATGTFSPSSTRTTWFRDMRTNSFAGRSTALDPTSRPATSCGSLRSG